MFLSDLLVVFAVTAVVVFLFGRAQIPSVIGLLVSGVVVGPYGLSLVDDLESVGGSAVRRLAWLLWI